jgi:starch synthase
LRRQTQLPDSNAPLFVSVSRITGQKGFTLLIPALQQFLSTTDAQVLLMGTGEQQYIQPLRGLEQQFPQQFRLLEGFDEPLSHQVEAAGDFFLMPSLFEPCGLNQIYSLRYGTVPLVRATGGLKDTVTDLSSRGATGVVFAEPTVAALVEAMSVASALYRNKRRYRSVQQRGMAQVFDWQQAAIAYQALYRQTLANAE